MSARVIQGYFPGGRPRIFAPPATAQRKAAQPQQQHGNAMPLPDTLQHVGRGGTGRPLPEALQQKMESFFRASFGDVRVHVGPQAQRPSARSPSRWAPTSISRRASMIRNPRGQQLLGHELAHVVQQRQGRVRNPIGAGIAVVQDRASRPRPTASASARRCSR